MKVNLKVPDSLNEITLAQYQGFIKESKDLEGDELKASMIHHFCFVKREAVNLIKKTSIDDICLHLDALFSVEHPLVPLIEIKDVRMGFIPKLEDMSFGEYIDLDKYVNEWETMHQAMAVLYRPLTQEIKEEYNIREYEGTEAYSELMKLISMDAVLGSMVFFYDLGNELLKAIPHYLNQEVEKVTSQSQHNSTETGDGLTQSINLLRVTLEDLTKLLKFDLHKHLHS